MGVKQILVKNHPEVVGPRGVVQDHPFTDLLCTFPYFLIECHFLCFYFCCLFLCLSAASDTQSGVSDFTSLSGEEESRAEQEAHPGHSFVFFVLIFLDLRSLNAIFCTSL